WRRRYYRVYRTLLPVHHWAISRNAPRYLDELRRTQWLPREEVEQLQLKRLRRLVHHAEAHVGYYRELFQTAGITPESIRSLDALLSRRKFFSVFALDDQALRRYVDYVRRRQPALLDGYAEAFNVVATLLASHPVDPLRVGAIISSAQTLPAETRALVERQFGCRVFDKYGAREFS